MNRTDIEYLDYTWNPLAMRCTPVSEGCEHCWHIRMAKRLAGNGRFPDNVRAAWAGDGPPVMRWDHIEDPLKKRTPSRIGVQFMGDLFHDDVPPEHILQVWRVMYEARDHTFLILTKRPDRMERILNEWMPSAWQLAYLEPFPGALPNVWLGVTAENQQRLDERAPFLLRCPAAKRFVSYEPALGEMDAAPYLPCSTCNNSGIIGHSCDSSEDCPDCHGYSYYQGLEGSFLDYVIAGAETGPGARTMDPGWARGVRDQCKEAGVSYFFKQMSNKAPIPADLLVREWPGGGQ